MNRSVAKSVVVLWLTFSGFIGPANLALAEEMLTPDQFTNHFIAAMKSEEPSLVILSRATLSLRVQLEGLDADVLYLENLYRQYLQKPGDIEFLVGRHLRQFRFYWYRSDKTQRTSDRIVPLIRMESSLPESILKNGSEKPTELEDFVFERFIRDFIIVYAYDFPDSFSWMNTDDLENHGIKVSDLRTLAVDNLRAVLNDRIVRRYEDGVLLLLANDNYASSLLLLDELWETEKYSVIGDIVVIIPARNLIVVSGSQQHEELQTAVQIAGNAFETEPFPLSVRPLIRRNGKWEAYQP